MLPPAAAERLVKLCGLLGSDFEGERSAAAAAASRLLREHQLTWQDVLLSPGPTATPPEAHGWRGDVRFAQAHPAELTEWERRFLRALAKREAISPKQAAVLTKLVVRVRTAAERAA